MHNMKRPAQAPFGPPAIAHELLLVRPARHQRLPSSRHPGRPGQPIKLLILGMAQFIQFMIVFWIRFFHGLPQFIGFPSQKILEFPLISWETFRSFHVRELPAAWSWVPQRRSAACKGRPWRPAARGVPKSLRVSCPWSHIIHTDHHRSTLW